MLQEVGADLSESGLEDGPELEPESIEFWDAFNLLSSCRPVGMSSVAPIPVAEVLAYCQLHEVVDGPEMHRMIRAMDSAYLDWQNKEAKKADQKQDGIERDT